MQSHPPLPTMTTFKVLRWPKWATALDQPLLDLFHVELKKGLLGTCKLKDSKSPRSGAGTCPARHNPGAQPVPSSSRLPPTKFPLPRLTAWPPPASRVFSFPGSLFVSGSGFSSPAGQTVAPGQPALAPGREDPAGGLGEVSTQHPVPRSSPRPHLCSTPLQILFISLTCPHEFHSAATKPLLRPALCRTWCWAPAHTQSL